MYLHKNPSPSDLHYECLFYHFLMCCTFITTSPYTAVNFHWILTGETCFAHENWITPEILCRTVSSAVAISHQPQNYPLSIWLTDRPTDSCAIYSMLPLPQPNAGTYQKQNPWLTQRVQTKEPYLLQITAVAGPVDQVGRGHKKGTDCWKCGFFWCFTPTICWIWWCLVSFNVT